MKTQKDHFIYRLADKSRFSYDGLKRQRLVTPMLRDKDGELKAVDWEAALVTVAKVIKHAGKKNCKFCCMLFIDFHEATYGFFSTSIL